MFNVLSSERQTSTSISTAESTSISTADQKGSTHGSGGYNNWCALRKYDPRIEVMDLYQIEYSDWSRAKLKNSVAIHRIEVLAIVAQTSAMINVSRTRREDYSMTSLQLVIGEHEVELAENDIFDYFVIIQTSGGVHRAYRWRTDREQRKLDFKICSGGQPKSLL